MQSSTLVIWQDKYSLNMSEIDDQHKMLFDIMNRLWNAIIQRADNQRLADILEDLERYTVLHFTEEETFMRSIGYTDFDTHIQYHRTFVSFIQKEKKATQEGKEVSLELLHFLRDWLVNHILVEDRRYADQYQQAEKKPSSFLSRFFARLQH
ncbi:MAG: bacteriohemerythrin [Rhodocyclaceae bacterium]|nr:bacteriohemerythrin [Rhodocyclaceae bacterium]